MGGVSPYIAAHGRSRIPSIEALPLVGQPGGFPNCRALDRGGPLTPSKLAKSTGRSVATVSIHLAKLRSADVVRYDSQGRQTHYWLKHKAEIKGLLEMLGKTVEASAKLP
jgi:predicted transcriptional regulator